LLVEMAGGGYTKDAKDDVDLSGRLENVKL
jgi:hypothetical protein